MDKVYIITSGEYSDYHIKRVFLSREKAISYLNRVEQDSYDNYNIEEFELDDDKSFEIMHYVEMTCHEEHDGEVRVFTSFGKTNTLDNNTQDLEIVNFYKNNPFSNSVKIRRVLPPDYNKEVINEKYRIILKSVMAGCKFEYNQGKSLKHINNNLEKSVKLLEIMY